MKILNNYLFISFFLLLFATKTIGQTYTINTGGSVTTCSGTIYDSGGSGGNYGNNENNIMTFCSSSSNCISITFTAFDVENNYDRLRIYDGPTTAYAVAGNYDNSNVPALPFTITSTSGCLTLRFTSDGSNTGNFAATINCAACPATPSYNNPNGFIYNCNALFYDNGGSAGNYTKNQNRTTKICSNSSNCVIATFTSFTTEASVDILRIYDGNSTAATLIGAYSGTTSPGTITSSTGCLTFNFTSDNTNTNFAGWAATISCGTCATPPPSSPQNCNGATTVCSDQAFSGNSSGSGSIIDLNSSNDGCLSGENQSSWYFFSPTANGVVELNITPANGTDDYDFAIWGPLATITCPPVGAPLRCSFAAGGGTTGLRLLSGDLTEGASGNRFVNQLNVIAGEKYILVVDNFSESTQPFTLDWTLSGATLGCTPLPIELLSFSGKNMGKRILLEWTTATEINNSFFTLERSKDADKFDEVAIIEGAGNSASIINYNKLDESPYYGVTYYRLKQTDYNGDYSYSHVISIENGLDDVELSNVHPNPTTSDINFDFYSPISGIIKVQILDYTGRVVSDENQTIGEGKTSLNAKIGELAKGIYSLKISFEQTGYSSVNMIIKQ